MFFVVYSPTVLEWLEIIAIARNELLNPKEAMQIILEETRKDVDKQFDENQSVWKPLRPYTINKKSAMNADMRILHETRTGSGLRLRDAYAKAGFVTNNGQLVYTYPVEKPYAKEHQFGKGTPPKDKPRQTAKKTRLTRVKSSEDYLAMMIMDMQKDTSEELAAKINPILEAFEKSANESRVALANALNQIKESFTNENKRNFEVTDEFLATLEQVAQPIQIVKL